MVYNFTKDEFIQKCKELKVKKFVANYFNLSIYLLEKYMKQNNIIFNWKDRYRTNKWNFITKEWLKTNWLNTTKSLNDISLEFNIDLHYLEVQAKKYNLKKPYKYKFNLKKLYNLSDANVWYLAGLLATDGYLSSNSNYIEIGLTGLDERNLLQEINNYFENEKNPYFFKNNITRIVFSDNNIKEFFKLNFNIYDINKTFTINVPFKFYNEDCAKAYVLGCLDGDGSISKDGYKFSLCTASELFVKGLKNIIETFIPNIYLIYGHVGKNKYPYIGTTGKNTKLLLDWIYSTTCSFKLNRKYKRYCII